MYSMKKKQKLVKPRNKIAVIIAVLLIVASMPGVAQISYATEASLTTAPVGANSLTYNGSEQSLLSTLGEGNLGDVMYSVNGGAWSSSEPKATDAGSYTIDYYVHATDQENDTDLGSEASPAGTIGPVVIAAKSMDKDNTTIELSSDSIEYTGLAIEPTVTVKDGGITLSEGTDYSVTYDDNTNVGTATVTIANGSGSNYDFATDANKPVKNFAITTATCSFSASVSGASNLVYDKTEQSLLSNLGTAVGGTIKYKVDDGAWSASAPKATEAGTHTVYYYIDSNDANYADLGGEGDGAEAGHVDVTIAPKDITITGITADDKTFDGTANATLDYSNVVFAGIETGDTLSVTATGTFSDENAGADKTVSISGLTLGGADVANYQLALSGHQTSATATISKLALDNTTATVTVSSSEAYTGSAIEPAATVRVNGVVLDASNYDVDYSDNTNVGTATVTVITKADTNYTFATGAAAVKTTFEITRALATLTTTPVGNISLTYDGTAQSLLTTAGVADGGTVMYKLGDNGEWTSSVPTATAAGTYTIRYYIEGDANHEDNGGPTAVINSVGATIAKKDLTVTALDQTIQYGDSISEDADKYTAVGTVAGESAVVTLGADSARGKVVPSVVVSRNDVDVSANYDITLNEGNLVVTPVTLTVNAEAKSKTFGQSDPELTYTVTGFVNGDTAGSVMTGSLTRAAGEDAGTYAITQGTLDAGSHYTISYTGADLTINKKSISGAEITFAHDEIEYTGSLLAPSVTSVILDGNTLTADVDYELDDTGENSATAYGTYTFKIKGKGNYNGTESKQWQIARSIPTVATAVTKTITYGQAISTGDFSGSMEFSGTPVPGTFEWKDTVDSSEKPSAGVHNYEALFTPTDSGNYSTATVSVAVTVNPAELSVTADAASKTYGQADPTFTYTATGFVNNDTDAIMTGALSRASGDDAGTYAITQGTLSAGSNYTINYTGANLTIGKKSIEGALITLAHDEIEYTGSLITPTITSVVLDGNTLTLNSDYEMDDTGENSGTSYGTYTLKIKGKGNYNGTESKQWQIARSIPTVATAVTKTITYGQAISSGDFSGSMEYSGTPVSGTFAWKNTVDTTTKPSVGTHHFDALFTPTDTDNFSTATVDVTVTVNPKSITVVADNATKVSGAANPTFTYTVTGLVGNDTKDTVFSGALACAADASTAPGSTVPITQGTLSVTSANYTLGGFTNGTLTVTAPDISGKTVNFSDVTDTQAVLYGSIYPEGYADAQYVSEVGFEYKRASDSSYTGVSTVFADAFTKTITGLTADTDYVFRAYTISVGEVAKEYGDVMEFHTKKTVEDTSATGKITVNVSRTGAGDTREVIVSVENGNEVLDSSNLGNLSATALTHDFENLADGNYNVVATTVDGKFIETKMVTIDGGADETVDFEILEGKIATVVEVKTEDTPKVSVSGLGDILTNTDKSDAAAGTKDIEVSLEAEKKTESNAEGVTQIKSILSSGQALGLILDLSLIKTVTTLDANGYETAVTTTDIGGTNTRVLEIAVPYVTTGLDGVFVSRYHGGAAANLTKLDARATGTFTDGTYFIDSDNSVIYIYGSGFSTYAIGYLSADSGSSSSGDNNSSSSDNNSSSGKSSSSDKSSSKNKSSSSDKSGSSDSSGSSSNASNNGANSSSLSIAKTGDNTPSIWTFIIVMFVGIAGAVFVGGAYISKLDDED